jgi:hypothetical protein
MQIFIAQHEETCHLVNICIKDTTFKTDLSQRNRVQRCGLD